jgi:transaldolase
MNKPTNLQSKIFLDSGDPAETRTALSELGFLDGQTTNPTLVTKNPEIQKKIQSGQKLTKESLNGFYKEIIQEISSLIPQGSVSIEVDAKPDSTKEDLLKQAEEMFAWIPNAHIKFPTTKAGLGASEAFVKKGGRVNMTLCFTSEQAAAVYAATLGAKPRDVFYSSFIGRLFDNHINGITQLENVLKLYKKGDGHVHVLAASFRSLAQFQASLIAKPEIITVSLPLILEWKKAGLEITTHLDLSSPNLTEPKYQEIDLNKPWESYDIYNSQTEEGLIKFVKDWENLLG